MSTDSTTIPETISRELLQETAKELQEVMALKPPIDIKAKSEVLIAKITEAVTPLPDDPETGLFEGDSINDDAIYTLNELDIIPSDVKAAWKQKIERIYQEREGVHAPPKPADEIKLPEGTDKLGSRSSANTGIIDAYLLEGITRKDLITVMALKWYDGYREQAGRVLDGHLTRLKNRSEDRGFTINKYEDGFMKAVLGGEEPQKKEEPPKREEPSKPGPESEPEEEVEEEIKSFRKAEEPIQVRYSDKEETGSVSVSITVNIPINGDYTEQLESVIKAFGKIR